MLPKQNKYREIQGNTAVSIAFFGFIEYNTVQESTGCMCMA